MIRSVIRGSGSALPKRVVTNAELAKTVDTSDEWIRERTGITQRYIAGEGETTSTLATGAARAALADAGIEAKAIDLISQLSKAFAADDHAAANKAATRMKYWRKFLEESRARRVALEDAL